MPGRHGHRASATAGSFTSSPTAATRAACRWAPGTSWCTTRAARRTPTRDVVIQEGQTTTVDFSLIDVRGPAFAGTTVLPARRTRPDPTSWRPSPTYSGVAERHLLLPRRRRAALRAAADRGRSRARAWCAARSPASPWAAASSTGSPPDDLGSATSSRLGAPVADVPLPGREHPDRRRPTWRPPAAGRWRAPATPRTRASGPASIPNGDRRRRRRPSCPATTTPPRARCAGSPARTPRAASRAATTSTAAPPRCYSPVYNLSGYSGVTVSYWRWYTNDTG